MEIVIASVGRPADVYACFSLARELQERGHSVLMCTPEKHRSKVMQLGFRMLTIGASLEDYLNGAAGAEILASQVPVQFVSLRDALREADVLVGNMFLLSGPSMAEQFGVKYFYVITSPLLLQENDYRKFGVPIRRKAGLLSGILKGRDGQEWDSKALPAINNERKYSGMTEIDDLFKHLFRSGHIVYALDPQAWSIASEASQTITGFLHYETDLNLPEAVENFLNSGEPPVVYAPGASPQEDVQKTCREITNHGRRALVAHPGVHLFAQQCLEIESQFVTKAIPRSVAVVHSGALDIAISAARAGVPQLIMPSLIEELRWAEGMKRIGICADDLATVLSDVTLMETARAVGERLRTENGAAKAADVICSL